MNVYEGRRYLIVVGDVNLYFMLRAFAENVNAKLRCVKYVVIKDYSHKV